jgi:hypothetical protein
MVAHIRKLKEAIQVAGVPQLWYFFPDFFTSPGMIVGDSMLCYDSLEKLQSSRIGSEFGGLSESINIAVL